MGGPAGRGGRRDAAARIRAADAALERLAPGPKVDLVGPGAAGLAVQGQVVQGDRIGRQEAVLGLVLGDLRPAFGQNLAVDDHVGDVDAVLAELARHALRQGPQTEFWHRQVVKTGPAAKRRRGAREQDRARAPGRHHPGRGAADMEAAKAADPPALLELRRRGLEDALEYEGAGVEDHDVGIAKIRPHRGEQRIDVAFGRNIAGVGPALAADPVDLLDEELEPVGAAPNAGPTPAMTAISVSAMALSSSGKCIMIPATRCGPGWRNYSNRDWKRNSHSRKAAAGRYRA